MAVIAYGRLEMLRLRVMRLVSVGLAIASATCGSGPAAPSVLQVGGTWTGTATLTKAVGGECFEPTYAFFVGYEPAPMTFSISQNSSNLSSSTQGCTLTGTAGLSTFLLTATQSTCPEIQRNQLCPDNLTRRDIALVEQTISGSVTGNTMSVTIVEQDNVFAAGTATLVGTLSTTIS